MATRVVLPCGLFAKHASMRRMAMKYKSVFDIIGPVMVGLSSSHTAGVAGIGRLAGSIFGGQPDHVEIYRYGSFKDTYKGHGTEVALIGGLLGFDTDDDRISTAENKT